MERDLLDKRDQLSERWWRKEESKWSQVPAYKMVAKVGWDAGWNACFYLMQATKELAKRG